MFGRFAAFRLAVIKLTAKRAKEFGDECVGLDACSVMVKVCSRELLSVGKVDHFSTGRSSTNNAYKSLRFKIYGSHHNLAVYQLGIMRLKTELEA